jgi:outer membrane protein assembly factor BamA
MSSVGVTPPTRQVLVDDTNPSIIFTGTWGHDQGVSGIASANEEKILGPAFNNTATFSETDLSLSFTFTGTHHDSTINSLDMTWFNYRL